MDSVSQQAWSSVVGTEEASDGSSEEGTGMQTGSCGTVAGSERAQPGRFRVQPAKHFQYHAKSKIKNFFKKCSPKEENETFNVDVPKTMRQKFILTVLIKCLGILRQSTGCINV